MGNANKKRMTISQLVQNEVKLIIQNWIRILNVKLGWINDFDKVVVEYTKYFQLLKVLKWHHDAITNIRFSADCSKIVSTSYDNTACIYDILSWNKFKFSKDTLIGSTLQDFHQMEVLSTIQLWDVESGQELMKLKGHEGWIFDVNFSSDGKHIVSGSADNTIRIWDVNNGKEIKQLIGHSNGVNSVQFSPDGQMIVSSSYDNTIGIWNVKTGKRLKQLTGHSDFVWRARFSPNGRFIVSCSRDKTIQIWDVESKEQLKILKGHSSVITDVQYFPDGQTIVSCSNDKTICLWDVKTGYEIQKLKNAGMMSCVNVSSDCSTIMSGSWDGTIQIWR
ncbi:WD repeat-containing protein [Reticulomyxa filosa]|uniref:WD repeat-containing protein n=1 Tax=Reticulomyxa filosa TaxID=46433 RepID=X6MS77_RETFI|nr:WD repeat-containing protein [Reticulomyxa filosa]|eukprot:ETO16699.1 WD repeat-containing protein [Reticulomyxa filosa]